MPEEAQAQPAMLTLARESRGLTQTDVASLMTQASGDADTSVSQGYVSKAEAGRVAVTAERLELYATALGYPPNLLCQDPQVHGVGVGLIHHRKKASMPVSSVRRINALLVLTRIQLRGLARAARQDPGTVLFPHMEVDGYTPPRVVARRIREKWDIPSGPVANVIGAAEKAGALVVLRDLDSDLLDAVSQQQGNKAPILLVSNRAPGCRCRFSVAHEIGHLIMHQEPGVGTKQEKEADAFAAEFLMPAKDIRAAFPARLTVAELADLKRTWGVSMAALLRRAQSLSIITDWQYRTLTIEMSTLGYRTSEPVDIPLERPQAVPELVAALRQEHGISDEEAASCSFLLKDEFVRLYHDDHRSLSANTAPKARP
ncbi:ImmA/IrrE family metallo-endopeptidase [Nocardiopsis sp. TNDT3]|uniref:helix-turn-helix domain-containing protein n=1 Tax=Nocardiopsis sp. TNDT3 TaxID=2249354 RepID=UPI000E3C2C90|nr:XRE family transcriptional regulator [Nocardiopsis sp. TNDT3]